MAGKSCMSIIPTVSFERYKRCTYRTKQHTYVRSCTGESVSDKLWFSSYTCIAGEERRMNIPYLVSSVAIFAFGG